jgi:hypothetical protein
LSVPSCLGVIPRHTAKSRALLGTDRIWVSRSHCLIGENQAKEVAFTAHLRRGHGRSATALLKAGVQLPQGSLQHLARAATRAVLPRGLRTFARRLARPPHPDWLMEGWFELDSARPIGDRGLAMLRFEDRNSVACSILNRMPLLTVELQEFVRSLPPEYLVAALLECPPGLTAGSTPALRKNRHAGQPRKVIASPLALCMAIQRSM